MSRRTRSSGPRNRTSSSGKPIILLTNDDGYFSPGIEALAGLIRKFANAYIVAPDRERSAQSLSLTLRRPLRIHRVRPRVFSVDGTPADCIYLALKKVLPRKPDLVISGMNLGPNIGRQDISYSGTVAAAIQGTYLGIPSVAFSLLPDGRGHFDPAAAAPFAERIIRRLLRKRLPEGITLNVNIPALPVRGFRITNLGQKRYDPEIIVRKAPRDVVSYWIGPGHPVPSGDGDSDVHASGLGFITLTPLHNDLTDYAMMKSPLLKSLCSRSRRG